MKRFLGILSLIIVVGTEVLTPITYANDLVLNEEVYQSVDSNISDIPENDNVAGDQNDVSGDNNFSDNTDEDTGEQASLSSEGEENNGTVEQAETDEKDTQEQEEADSVAVSDDVQGTDTVQCEDAILHGIYDEECVFQEKCEDGYNLEENECVLIENAGSDHGENEETVEENKEEESSSTVVVEDTDFSFMDSLSDIAKEIIGGLRYFFTRDSDSFIKYSTSGDEGIIVLIDPESGDSMTIMDKNLGAESMSEEDEKSYGNYFQWGSNNGISGDKIADFIENEEVNSTGDWNGDDEEIQGPCPTGYHIPTQNEWTSLVNVWRKIHTQDVRENVDDEGTSTVTRKTRSTKGSILLTSLEKCNEGDIEVEGNCIAENEISGLESLFMSDLKLPKAGSYSANGEYRDGVGSYWTVTPSENVTTQSEIFSIDKYFGKGIYDDEKDRTSWHNVRCFLDTKVKEKVVEDNLNKEEIVGELEHDGVVVKVIAPVGSFYEGTEPRIKVITEDDGLDDVKDEIAGSQDNVSKESKMVAFDISFMYKVGTGEIEVQPVEGKTVKVLFDYKLNDDFLNAETDENQEVKVFHLEETKETTEEDIDSEQGESVEEVKTTVVDVTNEEESAGTGFIVADGEKFSIYVLTLVENNSDVITLDGNGGMLDDDTNIVNLECDNETNICTGDISSVNENIEFPGATRQHAFFLGWIGSGTDTGLDSLTKNPILSTGTVAGHTYKAKYTCDYGYVDIDNVCVLLADAPATGLVYDSESQTITVWGSVNGTKMRYTIQDRNVGATKIGTGAVQSDTQKIGKYFQWGNNYGLYKGASGFDSAGDAVSIGNVEPSTYYSGTFVNAVDKQYKPAYTGNIDVIKNLWGGNSNTGDWNASRGPCPEGYHVPSYVEMNGIINIGQNILGYDSIGNNKTRVDGIANLFYIPFGGFGLPNNSKFSVYKDHTAQFWTRTSNNTNNNDNGVFPYLVEFNHGTNAQYVGVAVKTTNDRSTRWMMPIRCFQDYANCALGQIKDGLNCVDFPGINIEFNPNGGTMSGDSSYFSQQTEVTLDLSQYIAEKPGYYFVGWSESQNANRGFIGEKTFTGNTILYAVYLDLSTYTFVDGSGNILGTGYYESGAVSDMTKLIPLSYYSSGSDDTSIYADLITLGVFESGKGWRWSPELPSDGIATGDLVLQGEIEDVFTYNFLDINGDSYYSGLVLSGGVIKEINPGKQSDYQFISWYEDSDFNTEFDFTTKIFDNITLYPKFRQLYCTFTTGTSTLSGLKITGFDGEQSYDCLTHFVVPSEINGKVVVEIASNAFNWSSGKQIITGEINLPDSILKIDSYAFKNNDISGSFRFPKNLEYLQEEAFYGNEISGTLKFPGTILSKIMGTAFRCNLIENLVISEGITKVNSNAYNTDGCTSKKSLKSVIFPTTLESIAGHAFKHQNISGKLILPESLTSIAEKAFRGNNISGSLELPESLTRIGAEAFFDNNISGKLRIPGSVGEVTTAFECNLIEELEIGEGTTKIDNHAFSTSDCKTKQTLKKLKLPETLESIGDSAFYLQKIEGEFIFPESLTTLGTAVFKGNNLSGTLTVPGRLNGGRLNGAFRCNEFESVIVESGISLIGENAFYDSTDCPESKFKIKNVQLPSTLTGIEFNAFRNHQLTGISLGENVRFIWSNALAGNNIKSVYIPDSMVSLSGGAFMQGKGENVYVTGYVTTKKSTLDYTGAYISPVYQLYTYTFVDEAGTVLGTGYYPEILESNTTKLIPLDYYNGIGDISTFTSVDSLINPGAGHIVRWSTELSENSVVTQNLVVTGTVVELHSVTFKNPFTGDIVKQVAHNEIVERPADYVKEGFEFDGWYSGDTKFVFTTPIVSDLVLTGVYIPVKYQLSFYSDKNKTDLLSGILYDFNAEVQTQPIADPTKTDYDFLGWKAITGDYDISFPLTMSSDLEVYANWESPKYENLVGWDGCYRYVTYTGDSANQFYAEIIDYSGGNSCTTENLTMPNIITRNGRSYTIKKLGGGSFYNKGLSGEITLPTSLEVIGNGALHSNSYITSVNISEGLVSIGDASFAYDTRLKEINLPNTLKVIGGGAFYSGGLDHITIPSSVEVISGGAFQNNRLSSITILGNSLREIGDYAFNGSTVTGVRLPDSLETLGNKAFCTSNGTNTGSIVGILTSSANVENRIAQLSGSHNDTCLDLKKSSYVIKFVNYNGFELQSSNVNYKELPHYTSATPTKPATPEHTFTFAGWTPTIVEATEDAVYTATYNSTVRQYTITFNNDDGTELLSDEYAYGTLAADITQPTNPTKTGDAQYNYTFAGWSSEVANVTEDAVYTATYDSNINQYTIIFKNDDGTELKKETLNYGSGIVPPTATKTATAQYTYHFAGWNPELPEGATVSSDAVYTATYTETTNTYEIIWKNEDGTVLETDSAVAYGTTPVYNGSIPQKTGDAQYSYTFNTWSPAVSQVTGNATYTATYTQTVNKYTAIFENYDGIELYELENIPYGTVPTYGGSTPVKPQDERYIYTFNNTWLPSLVGITGDTTYTAQYDKVDRLYTITFKDGEAESSNTYTYQTATGDLQIPNRSKTGHTLVWQPDLSPVVQDQVYTASYVRNSYKVSTLAETGVDHIDGSGTYLYEAEVTFTGYAKSGYHFDDGDVVLTHTFNVPAYDSIVKMNANPNMYKVRYLKNGGVGTPMADQTFTYDETGALAVNTFVKTGSYFKGWLDEDNNMYSDGQEVINLTGEDNGIVLLIAQWSDTAKHTLKVIDTDGSVLQTKLYSSGDIISLDTPTKKGYLFVEWTNYPENGLMPDRDIEIGVVWKVNPDDQGQSSGQAGGGGGRIVPREDKVIIPEEEEHGAAQESGSQEVVQPKETDKDNDLSLTLYQWAYKYGITTKREDESNPDGVLLRGHMAKIMVNYVVNVLGRKEPKVIPDRCSFIDNEIDWKSEEIKQYSKRACALGLMGINVETFNPNAVVTRAQFGTVLSRVLWGDKYNLTGASYYDLHLKALKRKGIMTKIEHPINVVEIRKWAWLMLRRAYEDYEIKD